MKKVAFITLGCKVNQYETNAMTQKFIESGYTIVEHNEKADIYIINTCTVTNMSDRKSRQMLRRVKELNPEAIVVACGCYAQVAKKELEKIEEIDLILGNNEKKKIVEYVEKAKKENQIEIEDVMSQREFVDFGDVTYTEKTRAVIKVQDGCDRFCSYCIIPYARGRVRSRKPESIISEIHKIAKEGIQEVVITGIHIASYGKDFKEDYRLINLLEEINKIDGIKRIRLGSIEPLLITEEFMERLIKLEKVCHHFHLSLQSGCDKTLKRMNRRYTTKEFEEIVKLIRKHYEDAVLTTDIIVGFPGETEEEFNQTYKFLKEIKFYKMHVFKYSQRKGTKAAEMQEQVDGNKKEERSQKLIELSNQNEQKYNQSYVGKKVEVLFEEEKNGIYKGHTKNYILTYLPKENVKSKIENKIVEVVVTKAEEDHIVAKI
jgi:threonylcarbamoyladenosine tRNA methylthiotransferase MtaB